MALLLRHFGNASGRIGAVEFGALGTLPLALVIVLVSALLANTGTMAWLAWALGATAVLPLWVLTAKRLADLGIGRLPALALGLAYGVHLGLAGLAMAQGQSAADWLFIVPAPGAIPADAVMLGLWIATGLGLLASLLALSAIPGQPRDNEFGPDPRIRLAMAADRDDGALEVWSGRLLAAPSRAFANTGRLTLIVVPVLMLAAGLLRYDPTAGQLTTVLQTSSIGGIGIVEGMLRGGLVAVLFAPPIILVAMIVLPIIAGMGLWAAVRWRTYGRAEAMPLNVEVRGPDPEIRDRRAG